MRFPRKNNKFDYYAAIFKLLPLWQFGLKLRIPQQNDENCHDDGLQYALSPSS